LLCLTECCQGLPHPAETPTPVPAEVPAAVEDPLYSEDVVSTVPELSLESSQRQLEAVKDAVLPSGSTTVAGSDDSMASPVIEEPTPPTTQSHPDPEPLVHEPVEVEQVEHIEDTDETQTVHEDDDPPGLGHVQRDGSLASTVPDDDNVSEKGVADLIANGAPGSPDEVPDAHEVPVTTDDDTSLGGTETSTATTLVSANTSTNYGDLSFASVSVSTRPDAKTVSPSANRLSISYADGNKRLLINANVVKSLKVFRAEKRVEVEINLERTENGDLKGILVRHFISLFIHPAHLPAKG
jgi:20S proteasome subunit alpha 6